MCDGAGFEATTDGIAEGPGANLGVNRTPALRSIGATVEQGVILLEDFLYRRSVLTSVNYHLSGRGRIEKGYVADIIALEPDEFSSIAYFESRHSLSIGIVYSIINDRLIVINNEYTGVLPGKVLRQSQ